eukprot:TRINITY_DN11442_c0_g1_i1.p1 TRINITY_DN11442_c0_g1~~TRINITY_DN11442_c0_g1_i1.p1  ORF type:complete len:140 (+),score=2.89 TRINITY_DN11442_c0_g1_i1:337-756(+)
MGKEAFFDAACKHLKLSQLIEAFNSGLARTQRMVESNPRLAVPQGFVDTKHREYRMELLLPLIVEFPRYSGQHYKFALVVDKSKQLNRKYVVKSILTLDMAYGNARLIGNVDSLWLYHGNKQNKNENKKDCNVFCITPY